jgi:hypothetical protein
MEKFTLMQDGFYPERFSFSFIRSVRLPITERIAGIRKIAPISENPTAIRVVMPKLLMIGKLDRQRAEKPKKVASPDIVIAVPILFTLSWIAAM